MTNLRLSTIALLIFATISVAHAQSEEIGRIISAYRSVLDVSAPTIVVPTVVEIPLDREYIERPDFLVVDVSDDSLEPSLLMRGRTVKEPLYIETTDALLQPASYLVDSDRSTFAEFPSNGTEKTVTLLISSGRPVRSSSLVLDLPENVALPQTVAITTIGESGRRIVVAQRRVEGATIRYPETVSSIWEVQFTHHQPLRISELRLDNRDVEITGRALRFLAQPGHQYRVFFDPDRSVSFVLPEAGNYATERGVLRLAYAASKVNSIYKEADTDSDGVPDLRDNCLRSSNPLQEDVNGDGLGDACDDYDRDGIENERDNCPNAPNVRQSDEDGDGIGNECDGEESRITEKHAWIPWAGVGFAALVLVVLFGLTFQHMKVMPVKKENEKEGDSVDGQR